jgi:hypothetical protein
MSDVRVSSGIRESQKSKLKSKKSKPESLFFILTFPACAADRDFLFYQTIIFVKKSSCHLISKAGKKFIEKDRLFPGECHHNGPFSFFNGM